MKIKLRKLALMVAAIVLAIMPCTLLSACFFDFDKGEDGKIQRHIYTFTEADMEITFLDTDPEYQQRLFEFCGCANKKEYEKYILSLSETDQMYAGSTVELFGDQLVMTTPGFGNGAAATYTIVREGNKMSMLSYSSKNELIKVDMSAEILPDGKMALISQVDATGEIETLYLYYHSENPLEYVADENDNNANANTNTNGTLSVKEGDVFKPVKYEVYADDGVDLTEFGSYTLEEYLGRYKNNQTLYRKLSAMTVTEFITYYPELMLDENQDLRMVFWKDNTFISCAKEMKDGEEVLHKYPYDGTYTLDGASITISYEGETKIKGEIKDGKFVMTQENDRFAGVYLRVTAELTDETFNEDNLQ